MGRHICGQEVCMYVYVCACLYDGEISPQSARQDWGLGGTPPKQGVIHLLRKWNSSLKIPPRKRHRTRPWAVVFLSLLFPQIPSWLGWGGNATGRGPCTAILPCRIHSPAHPL